MINKIFTALLACIMLFFAACQTKEVISNSPGESLASSAAESIPSSEVMESPESEAAPEQEHLQVPLKDPLPDTNPVRTAAFPKDPAPMIALPPATANTLTLHGNWAAYNDDGMFFIGGHTLTLQRHFLWGDSLFYFDGESQIHLAHSDVLEISGLSENGLLLVQNSDSPPDTSAPLRLMDCIGNLKLMEYNVSTGEITELLSNVLSAFPVPDSPIVYYITPVAHASDEQPFILTLRSWNRETGEDLLLFTEDRTDAELYMHLAYDGRFVVAEEKLYLQLSYPYPSEFPYLRYIEISDGKVIIDNTQIELTEQRLQGNHSADNSSAQGKSPVAFTLPRYTIETKEQPDSRQLRLYAVHDGGDPLYLGNAERHDCDIAGDLFLFVADNILNVYDGENLYQFPYQALRVSYPLVLEDGVYFSHCLESVHPVNLHRLVYRDGTLCLEMVYNLESIDLENTNESAYWKRPYIIGNFILDNTYYDGCLIACNPANNGVAAVGGKDLVLAIRGAAEPQQ